MKKQFDKIKPTRIEGRWQHVVGGQEYLVESTFKEARPKRYRLFEISKDISQGVFQLDLPERWVIHNILNEDLLTQCRKLWFKR